MDSKFDDLIKAAGEVRGKFSLARDFSAGGVGAAIRSRGGKIFTGICLDMACGIGFCAEHAAIAEMLKSRETQIDCVVAVGKDGVMPPCGRCRELMAQIDRKNLDCQVILSGGRIVALKELLPDHWIQ